MNFMFLNIFFWISLSFQIWNDMEDINNTEKMNAGAEDETDSCECAHDKMNAGTEDTTEMDSESFEEDESQEKTNPESTQNEKKSAGSNNAPGTQDTSIEDAE